MKIKVGDTFERDYPFKQYSYPTIGYNGRQDGVEEAWAMGCNIHTEEYGQGYGETFYNADGLGKIIFEVLAITTMPRKFQDRVLYKFDRIDPDGKRINGSKCHTVTISKFLSLLDRPFSPEYEVAA